MPLKFVGPVAAVAAGFAVALPLGATWVGVTPPPALLATSALLVVLAVAFEALLLRHRRARIDFRTLFEQRTLAERRAAAHEVKGPLAVAMGHVELVQEDPGLDPEHREALEAALRSTRRTLVLVDALVAGAPTGVTLPTSGTDVAALVREAVQDMVPLAARRRVSLSLDAPEPALVTGDPSQLRQVVDNLLSNAVKYAEEDGWADAVVVREDDRVLLQVTNAGTTLTPEEAAHALEADFRAAATLESGVPGSGIGLAVVKDLVSSHAGEVQLISDPETGTTTVRVLLPQG